MSSQPRKRKYKEGKRKFNPKRGGPGILMTCEQGREQKCEREGVDILQYYTSKQDVQQQQQQEEEEEENFSSSDTDTQPKKMMSLEEELKMLRQEQQPKKKKTNGGIFQEYDTGCKGSVFVMCTLPGCNLIPPVPKLCFKEETNDNNNNNNNKNNKEKNRDEDDNDNQRNENPIKKPRLDHEQVEESLARIQPNDENIKQDDKWDPVMIVRQVLSDQKKKTNTAPSSRFVTRMIPIQATCFASKQEIQLTANALIQRMLPRTTKSFAISVKKRLCNIFSSQELIDMMAGSVLKEIPSCKVDLTNPDVTIVVEICRTLFGISVVPNMNQDFSNFSLVAARES